MKATDALAKHLKSKGYKKAFALQGGAVVHILDSFHKFGIEVNYLHHEVSNALAAASLVRASGEKTLLVVTTGPGCVNAMTGILGAWQDSVPLLILSGQVRSNFTSYKLNVRQKGTQEAKILDIVKPITKKTFLINSEKQILNIIDKADEISNTGRPGPVWIDYPINFQWPDINIKLKKKDKKNLQKNDLKINQVCKMLKESNNPLFVFGNGIRLSGGLDILKKVVNKSNIPFVTTWSACDFFPTDYNLNLGIIGLYGQRGANKAINNADLLICIGTHLNVTHTSTRLDEFSKESKKIIINIDKEEIKNSSVQFDLKVNSDAKFFLENFQKKVTPLSKKNYFKFKSLNWYKSKETKYINSNNLINSLTKVNKETKSCIVIDGGGTALYAGFQSSNINYGQRVICSTAISSMGTGLAETIGAYFSRKFKKILCIIGDGSFLMNIQDLQSIKQYKIPAVILVVNNNGYLAIRNTQTDFLSKRWFGTHPEWGLSLPSIKKVSKGFNIDYMLLEKKTLKTQLKKLQNIKKPIIVELKADENQRLLFNQIYKKKPDGGVEPQNLSEMNKS